MATTDKDTDSRASSVKKLSGRCHCGAVRFEVVKPDAFRLLAGEQSLSVYAWGAKISQRFFCKHCGVHCFSQGHLEQLGGDYVSVNLNTVDDLDLANTKIVHWDGRHDNWQAGPRSTPWPL